MTAPLKTTPAACRLALIFAASEPVAVILRRGPAAWVEMIKWNTRKDVFEDGQWLRGRIYEERCGLSPDGTLLVYFALKHGRVDEASGYRQTFTAVSKPPFLTALAMWPQGDTWGGGGGFIDNRTLRLAYGANGTRHPHDGGTTEIYMAPLPRHHPDHAPRGVKIETDLDRYAPDRDFRVDNLIEGADWCGKDHRGRTIFTRNGALFCINKNKRETLLRDFNPDQHRPLAPSRRAQCW